MVEGFEWFDRAIYQKRHDIKYWHQMISDRIHLLKFVEEKDLSNPQVLRAANYRLQNVLENTAFKSSESEPKSYRTSHMAYKRSLAQPAALPPAILMRVCDLEDLIARADKDPGVAAVRLTWKLFHKKSSSKIVYRNGKRAFVKLSQKQPGNRINEFKAVQAVSETPLVDLSGFHHWPRMEGYAPLLINLEMPEKDIIKAIRQVQKARRNKADPSAKKISALRQDITKEIGRWISYGILPYFDLKIYCRINNRRLTQPKMIKLIWPDPKGPDKTEIFKSQTIPYAKSIFRESTLARLR